MKAIIIVEIKETAGVELSAEDIQETVDYMTSFAENITEFVDNESCRNINVIGQDFLFNQEGFVITDLHERTTTFINNLK